MNKDVYITVNADIMDKVAHFNIASFYCTALCDCVNWAIACKWTEKFSVLHIAIGYNNWTITGKEEGMGKPSGNPIGMEIR